MTINRTKGYIDTITRITSFAFCLLACIGCGGRISSLPPSEDGGEAFCLYQQNDTPCAFHGGNTEVSCSEAVFSPVGAAAVGCTCDNPGDGVSDAFCCRCPIFPPLCVDYVCRVADVSCTE